jgi:uncharacterized membrane protein (UPF0127 family)
MEIVTFETPEQQALGLQWLPSIQDDTLYKFPRILPGYEFHSQNVPEPFEIAFFSPEGYLLSIVLMTPPDSRTVAPPGSFYALEARPGVIKNAIAWRPS